MRIAVIAAHGRSGRAFVSEALNAGHEVRAGIRGDNPFQSHDRLTVVQCDATNAEQVTRLIDRCEAVVSLLGHVKGSDEFVQTAATATVLRAMEVAGVRRIVSLTGVGVWVPGDRFKRLIDGSNWLAARVGVERFEDGIRHVALLRASGLEWTVLRVLLLTDGRPGSFGLKAHGLPKVPTPRREVARAILRLLERAKFIRQAPVMTRR
jgi:putative NADH-flavin reductase